MHAASEETQRPLLLVAAAVIVEAGRVLLTRRPEDTHLGGLWEFPGGKVRPGEAPRAAVRRELLEECNLLVEPGGPLEVTFHRYPDRDVLLIFFLCRRLQERPVRHLGVSDHAWVPLEALDAYPMPPADAPVIQRLHDLADEFRGAEAHPEEAPHSEVTR